MVLRTYGFSVKELSQVARINEKGWLCQEFVTTLIRGKNLPTLENAVLARFREACVADNNNLGLVPVGSNLFELIEFTLTRKQPLNPLLDSDDDSSASLVEPTLFGVNVAKVREVIRLPALEPSLGKRPEVLGIFQLRGRPIPAIHLACALGFSKEPVSQTAQVLVTEFSGRLTGFVVAGARRIRRVSWDEVIPPQKDIFGGITGMMLDEKKRFVFIIDFEKILADIEGEQSPMFEQPALQAMTMVSSFPQRGFHGSDLPVVLVVDDSSTARKALIEIVRHFSCEIQECGDGEQAWQECLRLRERKKSFMVISDVEMPRLDGYSFVRRIRTDSRFAEIPFLLHSSLSGDSNKERALAAGADAFIGKFNRNDINLAVETCLSVLSQQGDIWNKVS